MFKSGYVSIIGETNAGKSTFLNRVMKEKVAIVSPKVQTTRTNIKGIYTDEKRQIIFVDTPGIHKVNSKLSGVMMDSAFKSIKDANVVAFVYSVAKKKPTVFDYNTLKSIKKAVKKSQKVICILNKVDRVKKEKIKEIKKELLEEYDFDTVFEISALNGKGVEEVVDYITEVLPEGPKYYPDEEYTDQTVREMSEEIIRGKALKFLREEIPHGIFVEIISFKNSKTKNGEEIYNIDAEICTKKDSHKGIIIGKNGEMLKKIGMYSRIDLEKFLETKVNLKLFVKVRKNWLDNNIYLDRFKENK